MKKLTLSSVCLAFVAALSAQKPTENLELKYKLNESGSHYFQATFLNQVWLRNNQSLPGTTVEGLSDNRTTDIGLRRTRMQLFGQVTDKVFLYFQFGMNNFNSQYNATSNRKVAAFFHDALCEYKVSESNALKIGGGLTIANGLSRFSQPSIASIATLDVPVFAQTTVDQTDIFSRKLSIYARGQISKMDYRVILSDPFPITSNGQALTDLTQNATFTPQGHHLQQGAYVMYQFFDHEGHTTPYMTGSYLGAKKVFNVSLGEIYQKNATWRKGTANDTIFEDLKLVCLETFLDVPLDVKKNTAINAYAGFFHTDYGKNYLRMNGIMNPANGTILKNLPKDAGSFYGNSMPMFGTGNVFYGQVAYLMPNDILSNGAQLLPYASLNVSKYQRLNNESIFTSNLGMNYLIKGHKAKFTLDWMNRPNVILRQESGKEFVDIGKRLNTFTLQYQIFL